MTQTQSAQESVKFGGYHGGYGHRDVWEGCWVAARRLQERYYRVLHTAADGSFYMLQFQVGSA